MAARAPALLVPRSPSEAVEAFGNGSGVTVLAGGTIVMPQLAQGRLAPRKVLWLGEAKLDGVSRTNGVVAIGATTPVAALVDGDEPLASAARHVGDVEVRGQATVGGNVCTRAGEVPRGDLQAPLLALEARAVVAGKAGRKRVPLDHLLANRARGPLLLAVEYDDLHRAAGYAAARRPHAHHYSILAVSVVRDAFGTRVALTGAGRHARRCPTVERALAEGVAPSEAAALVLQDVGRDLRDDALASAWYRRRILPTLVSRALGELERKRR